MLRLIRDWLNRYFSDPQSLILGLLLLAGFLIVMFLGEMLTPVFVGLVIAYLLDGMAIALQRIKVPRLVSVLLVFLLFLATLFILVVGLLPLLSRQIGQLLQELPAIVANGRDLLMRLPERYPEFITQTQIRQVLDFIGGELYVMIQRGTTIVFEPNSEELKVLAENALNERTNSTPAIAGGEIFLRTHKHLYCIAEGAPRAGR